MGRDGGRAGEQVHGRLGISGRFPRQTLSMVSAPLSCGTHHIGRMNAIAWLVEGARRDGSVSPLTVGSPLHRRIRRYVRVTVGSGMQERVAAAVSIKRWMRPRGIGRISLRVPRAACHGCRVGARWLNQVLTSFGWD